MPKQPFYKSSHSYKPSRTRRKGSFLKWLGVGLLIGVAGLFVTGILGVNSNTFMIREIPLPILMHALKDKGVRQALWSRNNWALHQRLDSLGFEEEIKAFYRPQIQDEVKLDQHIHQIFYNVSGYVGFAYQVNADGILVLKEKPDKDFQRWFQLAYLAGVVVGSRQELGEWYVISPGGSVAPYHKIAAMFPEAQLKEMILLRQSSP
jgi:hypothetical protein